MTAPPRIAVIGAGAWGIALACSLAPVAKVSLWTRTPVPAGTRNMPHLPQVTVPESVTISSSLPSEADIVLLVVPTQGLRDTSLALQKQLAAHVPVVTCCKGMEQGTFLLPLEVLAQTMPGRPAAVLSGPNFAIEVAQGMPSAATLATEDAALSAQLTQALTTPSLRLYAVRTRLVCNLLGLRKMSSPLGRALVWGQAWEKMPVLPSLPVL